jgi:hypothetical protein
MYFCFNYQSWKTHLKLKVFFPVERKIFIIIIIIIIIYIFVSVIQQGNLNFFARY